VGSAHLAICSILFAAVGLAFRFEISALVLIAVVLSVLRAYRTIAHA
jgi:hypothetical protein